MRRRLAALAVPLSVLALSLTACGGDDEPTDAAGTPSGTSSTVPTTEDTESAATEATEPTASEPTEPTEATEPTASEPTEASETPEPTASEPPAPPPSEPPAPPTDPNEPATTYAEAEQRLDALGQEPVDLDRFETPTGIYCLLSSDFLTGCELAGGGVPDPAVCGTDGPTQNVGRVEFGGGDPEPVCNSDTIREPGAKKLPLDSVARSSTTGITCLAQQVGVTCIDPGRTQGFFLGPEEYHVFSA